MDEELSPLRPKGGSTRRGQGRREWPQSAAGAQPADTAAQTIYDAPTHGELAVIARQWPRTAARPVSRPARRKKRLRILILALVVALMGSTALAAPALQRWGGFTWFPFFSPSALTKPFDPAPAHLTPSPQGCVDGVAPPPGQGPRGPIYTTRGYPGVGKEFALTFDDGPNPTYTPRILAELTNAGVHATFFVVGHHAQLFPDLVRAEWTSGDAVGNHTFNHEWIPGLTPDQLRATLDSTARAIGAATGDPCMWLFRAPYGEFIPPVRIPSLTSTPPPHKPPRRTPTPAPTPTMPVQVPVTVTQAWQVVHEAGYTPVQWDIDCKDWQRPGTQAIAQCIIAQLHPGAIILMHDSAPDNETQDRSQTVAALPAILAAIKARGLQPVTLPRLLADAGLITPPVPLSATPTPSAAVRLPSGGALLTTAEGYTRQAGP
jgi:peptidoglycan/xylan/chitin deacetylase (PgdA/CDA1 family)